MNLANIYSQFSAPDGGGDKGTAHSYIDIYETEMQKTKEISLLEIGVYQGHSIAMWQSYFENSQILGIDVTNDNLQFDVPMIIADATKPIPKLSNCEFDYIIDDGSHKVSDQIQSFELLFKHLKSGGKYFIEDITGDKELVEISQKLRQLGITFRIYDCRANKGRWDDILLVADKE